MKKDLCFFCARAETILFQYLWLQTIKGALSSYCTFVKAEKCYSFHNKHTVAFCHKRRAMFYAVTKEERANVKCLENHQRKWISITRQGIPLLSELSNNSLHIYWNTLIRFFKFDHMRCIICFITWLSDTSWSHEMVTFNQLQLPNLAYAQNRPLSEAYTTVIQRTVSETHAINALQAIRLPSFHK